MKEAACVAQCTERSAALWTRSVVLGVAQAAQQVWKRSSAPLLLPLAKDVLISSASRDEALVSVAAETHRFGGVLNASL